MYDYDDAPCIGDGSIFQPIFSQIVVINGNKTQFVNKYIDDAPYELIPSFMICLVCGNDGGINAFTSMHDDISFPYDGPFDGESQTPLYENDCTNNDAFNEYMNGNFCINCGATPMQHDDKSFSSCSLPQYG